MKLSLVKGDFPPHLPELIEMALTKEQAGMLIAATEMAMNTPRDFPRFFGVVNVKLMAGPAKLDEDDKGVYYCHPSEVQAMLQVLVNTSNAFTEYARNHIDSKKESKAVEQISLDTGEVFEELQAQATQQGWYPLDYPDLDLTAD